MSSVPGFIIYQDNWNSEIAVDYTDEELGAMFRAMLLYFDTGEVTEFTDRALKRGFSRACTTIDMNRQQYSETVLQRKYACYCREVKKRGEEPAPFEAWSFKQRISAS